MGHNFILDTDLQNGIFYFLIVFQDRNKRLFIEFLKNVSRVQIILGRKSMKRTHGYPS